MTLLTTIVLIIEGVSLVIVACEYINAPEGWQDEAGFHYDKRSEE